MLRSRASKLQFSVWKRPVGAMLMKALPRHSKVEAHLESYLHMEDFCVLYFLFCFSLRFATLFKFLKFPECSFAFHFFKSILQWTLIFTILFIVLSDSSYVYLYIFWFFSRWFLLLCFHVTFFRRPQHGAHCGGDRGGGCWRPWLRSLESHGLRVFNGFTTRRRCYFQHHFLCKRKITRRRETCVCTMPSKWHKFEAFHVLQLPWCRTGLCLVLIVCMPLGRIKLISFIFFIRMFVAQGQTTNAQAIRISRNICWKKRLNIAKYLNSARMIRLIFSCATDLGFFPIFSEFFQTSPGCAGGLVVGISDPSVPSKIGPWQLKWSNWTSK